VHLDRAKDEFRRRHEAQNLPEICIREFVVRALSEPLFGDGSSQPKKLGEWNRKAGIDSIVDAFAR